MQPEVHVFFQPGGRGGDRGAPRDDKCYECGERGHFARECRARFVLYLLTFLRSMLWFLLVLFKHECPFHTTVVAAAVEVAEAALGRGRGHLLVAGSLWSTDKLHVCLQICLSITHSKKTSIYFCSHECSTFLFSVVWASRLS